MSESYVYKNSGKVFSILILLLLHLFNAELSHAQSIENKSGFGLKTGVSLPVGGPKHNEVPFILLGLEYRTIWPSGLDVGINGDLQTDTDFLFGDGLASLMGMVHYHFPRTFLYAGIGIARYIILSYQTHKVFGFPIDIGILHRKLNFNIKYIYLPKVDEGDPYNTNLWNYSHLSFTVGWWFIKKSALE